ncbi:AraC family transcriptional regulator [Flavobacterium hiemivividum]|uniref:AraC family transcriptional regulator n=1 Tax=Flavobacterium hiemivividum TaxID=2541734 RepID=A0A4R5CYX4_9FLAO|nr:AraC family transcriptional regulator [Flavobacterium hiemivividum]TDE03804.1 AraC family transcriptional regulator [Flavobacterium hiemivividum]
MLKEKYYLSEVDANDSSIYCHHDLMGESFIETHFHKKAQFLYTEGGIVYVKTTTKTYFLPARHCMWIPSGVEHSIHPSSPDVIMRNLYFPVDKAEDDFYRNEGIYPVNDLVLNLMLFTNRWNGHILRNDKKRFTIAKAFKLLLPEILKVNLSLSLPLAKEARLQKIIEYMSENLDQAILFSELSERYGFSERSLHRLFQKDLGMSFMQFYTVQRMLKAIELIIEKKLPINEVALKVGYSSVPTFSNTFCKLLSQRPSDYLRGIEIFKKKKVD